MKFVSIVGARPQFIKAAPLSSALKTVHKEVSIHTGQHYDANMSGIFFEELQLPRPDYELGIDGGSHGEMTGRMLIAIEQVLARELPDCVIIFGDTNSTLAGALAAAKLNIPVAHIEAGLRSFNRRMPEELNRIVADHVATVLFAPSQIAAQQLAAEGITENVFVVGDIMLDAILMHKDRAATLGWVETTGLKKGKYFLCTLHRAETVDDPENLRQVLNALDSLSCRVLFPCHPRTRKMMARFRVQAGGNLMVTEPLGYLRMLEALQGARCILTDSGGIQKEAYYLGKPCVTLRHETEWTELVNIKWNKVVGIDGDAIRRAVSSFDGFHAPRPLLYGDGGAAQQIVQKLSTALSR